MKIKRFVHINEAKETKAEKLDYFGIEEDEFKMVFQDLFDKGMKIKVSSLGYYSKTSKKYFRNPPRFLKEYEAKLSFRFEFDEHGEYEDHNILSEVHQALERLYHMTDGKLKFSPKNNSFTLIKDVVNQDVKESEQVTFLEKPKEEIVKFLNNIIVNNGGGVQDWCSMENGVATYYNKCYTIEFNKHTEDLLYIDVYFNNQKRDQMISELSERSYAYMYAGEKSNVHHFFPLHNAIIYTLEDVLGTDGETVKSISSYGGLFQERVEENVFIDIGNDQKLKIWCDVNPETEIHIRAPRVSGFSKFFKKQQEDIKYDIYQMEIKVELVRGRSQDTIDSYRLPPDPD